MRTMVLGCLFSLLAFTAAPALADEAGAAQDGDAPSRLDFTTSLRAGVWSSDRNLDDRTGVSAGSFWLRGRAHWAPAFRTTFEGWLQRQGPDENHPGSPASEHAQLREAYTSFLGENLEVHAGRQLVVWGRADGINPTDSLNSRDARLLFAEPDDQRRGATMLRLNAPVGPVVLSAIWLAEFRPNTVPAPELPPGVQFQPLEVPTDRRQFAFKVDRSGGEVDWSVSYFDGRDRNFDVSASPGGAGVVLTRTFHRIRVYGADFAANAGRFGLRGEVALTATEDPAGTDPAVKNPFLLAVFGGDRTFFEYLNVNVQYIYRAVRHYHDPRAVADPLQRSVAVQNAIASGQLTSVQHGASTRVGYKWLNETLEAELFGIGFVESHQSFARAKIVYHVTDLLRITGGREVYAGPPDSLFGLQKKNSATFLELAYGY